MSNNTLEYYMSLDYPIELRPIAEELGGGYSACIPSLGRWTFFAEGDTIDEALEALQDAKKTLFEDFISRGKEIPLPPPAPELQAEEYSGRVLLRIPRRLHMEATKLAEQEGCSLNQLIMMALSKEVGGQLCATEIVDKAVQAIQVRLDQENDSITYQFRDETDKVLRLPASMPNRYVKTA